MDKAPNIAIVILAAGASKRMGDHIKQILPWKDSTLLGNALIQAKASIANDTYVVLGAYEEVIKAEVVMDGNTIIQNKNWEKGMGSSIAVALKRIETKPVSYDAVFIQLADQPKIDTNYINKMLGNWIGNRNKIITTKYENDQGVPAIFGSAYFEALTQLQEDVGAKAIINANLGNVIALNPEGKEIDIDSFETYQKALNTENKKT